MHLVEDLLQLYLNLNANRFTFFLQLAADGVEGGCGLRQINDHNHVEVPVDNRLGDVEDVDVMVTKSSGDTLICFMDGEDVVTYFKVE